MSLLNSFGLKHTIKEPTRITQTTQKCIDNILTNFMVDLTSTVLHFHISDQTAQKNTFNIEKELNTFIQKRYFSNDNKIKFKKLLSETCWEKIYNLDHSLVNEQWNEFMMQILVYFNNCFPLKKWLKGIIKVLNT